MVQRSERAAILRDLQGTVEAQVAATHTQQDDMTGSQIVSGVKRAEIEMMERLQLYEERRGNPPRTLDWVMRTRPDTSDMIEDLQGAPSPLHQEPPSLLGTLGRLPIEIRRMIYNRVLPEEHGDNDPISTTHRDWPKDFHKIMATSSAIYGEVWPMVYEERNIDISVSCKTTTFSIGSHLFSLKNVNLQTRLFKLDIRKITLHVIIFEIDNKGQTNNGLKAMMTELVYALKGAGLIQLLGINILIKTARMQDLVALGAGFPGRFSEQHVGLFGICFDALTAFETLHKVQEVEINEFVPSSVVVVEPFTKDMYKWARILYAKTVPKVKANMMAKTNSGREEMKLSIQDVLGIFGASGLRSDPIYLLGLLEDENMLDIQVPLP